MEPLLFYLKFFGILSIPCLLAIILFKKRVIKTVRATYYFTPVILAIFLIGNHLLFMRNPKSLFAVFLQ